MAAKAGQVLRAGTVTPPAASVGDNDDFYMDVIAMTIVGPKAAGAWPTSPVIYVQDTFRANAAILAEHIRQEENVVDILYANVHIINEMEREIFIQLATAVALTATALGTANQALYISKTIADVYNAAQDVMTLEQAQRISQIKNREL